MKPTDDIPPVVLENEARQDWRKFWKLPDSRTVWEWGEQHLVQSGSPFGTRFVSSLTPWIRQPAELVSDNTCRELTVRCCVQGGKTQLLQLAAMWAIAEDPGPMFLTFQSDDDAKEFAKIRFNPMSAQTEPVSRKLVGLDKTQRGQLMVNMSDMWLSMHGANENNLASKSVRWILNDEVWRWKPGLLDQARDRGTMFWNRRIINASTAGEAGSDIEEAFEAGSMHVWHLWCPSCENHFNPDFYKVLKWDKTVAAEKDIDWAAFGDSVRLVCPHCETAHVQTEALWRQMSRNGRYIQTNLRPIPGHWSFHWNCLTLSPAAYSWVDCAVQFVKALRQYEEGNEVLMKEFKTKRLGTKWDPSFAFFNRRTVPTSDFSMGDQWPDAEIRFIGVDVQADHFWFVCRDFAKDGRSRLVDCGRLETWDDIVTKQVEHSVRNQCVFIDLQHRTPEVKEHCAKYDWRAMKGDSREMFVWWEGSAKNRKKIVREYSRPEKADPTIGKRGHARRMAIYLSWSNPTIKERLWKLQTGNGLYFGIPDNAPEEYLKQMENERKVSRTGKNGRSVLEWVVRDSRTGCHMRDCECMILVGAIIAGCLMSAGGEEEKGTKK